MRLYGEFTKTISKYIETLNELTNGIDEKQYETPILGSIEVVVDQEVVGHLVDEIGAAWCFVPKDET